MADAPKTPGGTVALPENPELANLREREKALVDEIARLEGMDANKIARAPGGHDLTDVKRLANIHLTEVRRAIADLTPKPKAKEAKK